MVFELLAVFSIGVLTRIADMIADDGLRVGRYLGYAIAALYGFLATFVITHYPVLAELGIAVMLAVLFTSKIDHPIHATGIATMIFFIALYGIAPLNPVLLTIFILGGIADELGNNLSDKGRLKGITGRFFSYRLTMEAVAFAVSLYTGNWLIFMAMVAYDLGFMYIFTGSVRRKLLRLSGQR